MKSRWLLGALGLWCLMLLISVSHALTPEQEEQMAKYEAAIEEQMVKLKKLPKADAENKDAMKEAMDSVEHLKPKDLPIQDMIGMMGRVFQKTMGLNMKIKDHDTIEREAAEAKAAEEAEEAKKKAKKAKKRAEKKSKKGPKISGGKKEEL